MQTQEEDKKKLDISITITQLAQSKNNESRCKGNLEKKLVETNIKPVESKHNLEQNDITISMIIFILLVVLNARWASFIKK